MRSTDRIRRRNVRKRGSNARHVVKVLRVAKISIRTPPVAKFGTSPAAARLSGARMLLRHKRSRRPRKPGPGRTLDCPMPPTPKTHRTRRETEYPRSVGGPDRDAAGDVTTVKSVTSLVPLPAEISKPTVARSLPMPTYDRRCNTALRAGSRLSWSICRMRTIRSSVHRPTRLRRQQQRRAAPQARDDAGHARVTRPWCR